MGYFLPEVLDNLKIDQPDIFVETGTYMGGSPQRFIDTLGTLYYDILHTVEISKSLCEVAAARYVAYEHGARNLHSKNLFAEIENVNQFFNGALTLWCGNTVSVLPKILEQTNDRAVFWLDAHNGKPDYQGQARPPLIEEINYIHNHRADHVIAIDDVHLFGQNTKYADYRQLSIEKINLLAKNLNRKMHHISPFNMEMIVLE